MQLRTPAAEPTILDSTALGTVPRGPWIITPKTPLDELDAELRCLAWDAADAMERAVIDTAHRYRAWTEQLSNNENLQKNLAEGAENYAVTQGQYRHSNGLAWWPTGVVRRSNLRNGHREVWVLGIACDAFALLYRYGGERGRRRTRQRIRHLYVSADSQYQSVLDKAEHSERSMGTWYIAPLRIAFPNPDNWQPLWIEPTGPIAKQWRWQALREQLTLDGTKTLRYPEQSRYGNPPRVILWTPGDDPACAIAPS